MICQWPIWITYNHIFGGENKLTNMAMFLNFFPYQTTFRETRRMSFLPAAPGGHISRGTNSPLGILQKFAVVTLWIQVNDIVISPIWIDSILKEIFLGAFRGNQNEFALIGMRSHGVCKENKWYSEFIIDICRSFCKHGDGAFPHFAGVIKNYRPKQCTINNGKSRQKIHIFAVFDRLPQNG